MKIWLQNPRAWKPFPEIPTLAGEYCRRYNKRENCEEDGDMNITIREDRCIGCGMCAAAAPGVFAVVGAVSTVQRQPEAAEEKRAQDAANGCPVNAIKIKR